MHAFVVDLVSTLSTAGYLFMVSAGLTLVFGAMRVINLAHGSFYMYGAFLVSTIIGASSGALFWLAVPAAAVAVGALGALVEVTVMRRLYRSEHLTQLLATFALLLIFADVGLRLWGTNSRTVANPAPFHGRITVAGATFPSYDVAIIAVAVVVGLGLWAMLARTVFGWKVRAVVSDPEALATTGTNTGLLLTSVFVLGAALAAVAGAVVAPQTSVAPGIDQAIIVTAFIVAVIGGLGSIAGAAIGALLIAAAETLGTRYAPNWASTLIYGVLIVVLAARPWGLLGAAER